MTTTTITRGAAQAATNVATDCLEALCEVATSFTCDEADMIAMFFLQWADEPGSPRAASFAEDFLRAHGAGDEDPAKIPDTNDRHSHLSDGAS